MALDDPVGGPRVARRENVTCAAPPTRVGEVVGPAVAVVGTSPRTDHHGEPEEVDGREADRRPFGLGPLARDPPVILWVGGERERVVGRDLHRRRDAPAREAARRRLAPGDDEVRRARHAPHERPVHRRERAGIHRVGDARLPLDVGAVRRPEEEPEERRRPGIHVGAAFDEDHDVRLSDQPPHRAEEHGRDAHDLELRSFTDVPPEVRWVQRRDRDMDVPAQDGSHIVDVRTQEGFGTGVVRPVVSDQQDPRGIHRDHLQGPRSPQAAAVTPAG